MKSKLSFWVLQLGGWLVYSIAVVVTSVPLRHESDYVAFRATYVVSGFLGSFLLYRVCYAVSRRRYSLLISVAWCTPACLLLGFLSTAASVWAESRAGNIVRPYSWAVAFSGSTGTSFLFLTWCMMYFGIKHYQVLEQERLQRARSEALARDAQLRALRYQLQPHFLFNTLNAISMLILEERNDDARRTVARLADLLRNTIDAPDTHLVPLTEELLLVEQYLAIEEVRFGDRLKIRYDHDPLTAHLGVPRLLLQPLVENAVRHGIAARPEGGEIFIRSSLESGMLIIRVVNDCPKEQSSVCSDGYGVGLGNTQSRLEQMYGSDQRLETRRPQPSKFEVLLALPMKEQQFSIDSLDGPVIR